MKKQTYSFLVIALGLVAGISFLLINNNPKNQPGSRLNEVWHTPKVDKPDEFIKLYNDLRTRPSEEQPGYGNSYRLKELAKAKRSAAAARTTAVYNFIERGPGNVPGRTRALVVDPDDTSHLTWFAGGVGGGIWKTTDGGQTWVNKTENQPNLAISWLVMAESDRNILYAGTGEGWGGSVGFIKGSGIYKSTDRGETWALLPATQNNDFQIVNRLVVDPNNANIVLAATSNDAVNARAFRSGIYKSTDGGQTWVQKFSGLSWVQQIVATPGDFNVLYATVRGVGVYKSTDAGETWAQASSGMSPDGRIEMAVSPLNTSRLYASVVGSLSGNGADLYVSDDAGASWKVVTEETTGDDIDFLGGQGWYDNTILAHPFDPDMVYVGGVNFWKFEIRPGTVVEDKQFLGATEDGTSPFMTLVNFGAKYYGGRIEAGNETAEDFVSVEVRFGPDGQGGYLKQMAHRFHVPDGMGSGVPASDYTYQDYVEVPFQVWDVTNNRQLMVAFRDQQKDGVFNLLPQNFENSDAANNSREYVFISNITYNATTPDPDMANDGNHEFRNLYFFWPYLTDGGTWDAANLPASKFVITYETIEKRLKLTTSIADAYGEYSGNNRFSQTTGATATEGLHPDYHNIVPIIWDQGANSFQLLVATDGGVYKSDVGTNPGEPNGSWEMVGLGFNTAQFYAVDKAPGENRYIGGLQDNGSWMSQPGQEGAATAIYRRANAGDGFGCAWNYGNPNEIITTVYNNIIERSTDGGSSFRSATSGLSDVGGGSAPFVTEIENLPSDPDVVFTAGVSGVWRSTNFAGSWQLAAIDNQWSLASTMKVRVSHANAHIVWAGTAMQESPGKISLHVSTDEGETFVPVNNYTAVELGRLSGLATHPLLDSTAFALFSFAKGPKVLRTDNLGQSWYDISGFGTDTVSNNGFPDVALYDLVVMPYDTSIIWVGSEIGIFESTDAGASWHILNANMPAASVWDLKIVDKQVVIGTHGRGIWSVTIDELPGQVYLPEITSGSPSLAGELLLDAKMLSAFDSTQLFINGSYFSSISQPTEPGTLKIITNYSASNTGTAYLRSFYRGKPYVSHVYSFDLFDFNAVADSYENDFSVVSGDFIGNGFIERSYTGFSNQALHTSHPYVNNADYSYLLKTPIRVKSADALVNFHEVVLVEQGEAGALPGTHEFKDYVVVQGSLDGITWVNLLDEYDAGAYEDWANAGFNGGKELYKLRAINLLETFQADDVILIRFVLKANANGQGWGWAIDNLRIQTGNVVTGLKDESITLQYQAYPNPVTGNLLHIIRPGNSNPGVAVFYTTQGKQVLWQELGAAGKTTISLPADMPDGLYTVVITAGNRAEAHKILVQRTR